MSWYYYKPTKPIPTADGIKARSQRGKFAKNWWAMRWLDALERFINRGRLSRGKRYARQGQVISIDETPEGIKAKVQGSRRTPYKVTIDVTRLSDAAWEQVIEAMAGQAIFAAQLLAGDMPPGISEVFDEVGVSLFPKDQADLLTDCSCPDYANPCKHIAAVYYILGEQFDEDPFLLFRLRGRSQEEILAALRARRVAVPAEAEETPAEEESAPPLSLTDFWRGSAAPSPATVTIKPPVTPMPILKRLGQPAFTSENILRYFSPAYAAFTTEAIKLAFAEAEDDPGS